MSARVEDFEGKIELITDFGATKDSNSSGIGRLPAKTVAESVSA